MVRTLIKALFFFFTGPTILAAESPSPRVIGYLPDYRLNDTAFGNVPKCTDIVFFGSEILADGTIKFAGQKNPSFEKLKSTCQKHQVRLHLCLGGWKKDTHYPKVTADPALRAKVVESVLALKKAHGFEGVDYDWEYPKTKDEMNGFIALTRETNERLGKNFDVTAAFHPRHKIPKGLVDQLDRIHLMTYDLKELHCAIAHSHWAIKDWTARDVPREKLCIGIASYARDIKDWSKVKTYQQMFQEHGKTIHENMPAGGYFGDNQQTAFQKYNLARKDKLAGVIIWEIGQTPSGDDSILKLLPSK